MARCCLAGPCKVDRIAAGWSHALGREWPWIKPLARRYVEQFAGRVRPREREVMQFLHQDRSLLRAAVRHGRRLRVEQWLGEPSQMQPVAAAVGWTVRPIETVGAMLAWLGLTLAEAQWFADLRGLAEQDKQQKLRHYHYKVLLKRSGEVRLIEAPKARLKALQQRILGDILEQVPVHAAANGFVRGRSVKTFAEPHAGRCVVLRMDLRDFFPSFSRARVSSFFRTIGYPEPVADRLAGICTHATGKEAWADAWDVSPEQLRNTRALYARPHLPQGAPTSPALANLCMYRMDCRLSGLAAAMGAKYTRYADDLAFSGGNLFDRSVGRFGQQVAAIALEEGFAVHHRKTRVMRQSGRQLLAGLVVNAGVNVVRADYECLKATLTNCVRHGVEGQNREAVSDFRMHLLGRVAYVGMVHAERGARLRRLFEQIAWP